MKDRTAILDEFTKEYKQENIAPFRVGDTVKVSVKVKEEVKGKDGKASGKVRERIQVFEGLCIARKGGGIQETFKVRKISFGSIGVERTFPLHSPVIDKVEVSKQGKVRRAKLYYIRDRKGKAATQVKTRSRFKK
jgi:large subunit ribosomal protein L19